MLSYLDVSPVVVVLRDLLFGEGDSEYAVGDLSGDILPVDVIRESEALVEAGVGEFLSQEVAVLLLFLGVFLFALDGDGESVVVESDVAVLLADAGHCDFYGVGVVIFADVDSRSHFLSLVEPLPIVVEDAVPESRQPS